MSTCSYGIVYILLFVIIEDGEKAEDLTIPAALKLTWKASKELDFC